MRLSERLSGLLTGAVTALLCALAVEGALRVGWIPNPKHAVVANQRRWSAAQQRVLVLGDSFIAPQGGLAPLLDAALERRGVAVWNLAVSGTGPFEYLESLRAFDRETPDLVLLSYYAGNDLTDVRDNPKYDPQASGTAIHLLTPPLDPLPNRRWYHSLYGVHWLRPLWTPAPPPHPFDWEAFARAGIDAGLIADARRLEINPYLMELALRNPDHLLDNVLMEGDANARAWRRVVELLDGVREASRARGATLAIAVFPRSIQIDDSHFPFFEKLRFRVDPRTLGSREPQRRIADYARGRGVPLLDLQPVLREHGAEALYLEKDDHLNDTGNRVAAESIVPWLLGLLDV